MGIAGDIRSKVDLKSVPGKVGGSRRLCSKEQGYEGTVSQRGEARRGLIQSSV